MSKIELGALIHLSLRLSLEQNEKLLDHKRAADFLPVLKRLAHFIRKLETWYSGKFHLRTNDRFDYFLKEAQSIEAEADKISEEIWEYAPVSLVPIFLRLRDRREQLKNDDSYPRQLRAQFNNYRLTLLEQVSGARFLENSNDLGEEVERILVHYLNRRLGNNVRVLRGGHIYDYANNRSGQIDIIITPANALGFSPAGTTEGKYNVMLDQVVAAISVTSRLNVAEFRKRAEQLQKIPEFKEKDEKFPGLKDHHWPLCYIFCAECEDLAELEKAWSELDSGSPLCMLIALDSGYIIKKMFAPSKPMPGHPEKWTALALGKGVHAGLGLAWLEVQIVGRTAWLTNQRADWIHPMIRQIRDLEMIDRPLYDPLRESFFLGKIHGILQWGADGEWVHNRLFLSTIFTKESSLVVEATLFDLTKPTPPTGLRRYEFEPRWFKTRVFETNGHYCALEEWINPKDKQKCQRRIAVFDSRNGDEVTAKLKHRLSECSELQNISQTDISELDNR